MRIEESRGKDNKYIVTGAECHRGIQYALSEISDPRRIFTSTVRVNGGEVRLVPVRTEKPIKKDEWRHAAGIIKGLEIDAPVGFGSVIMEDFTEKGIDLIASRDIKREETKNGIA